MSGYNIIIFIAIILFARLGVRLFLRWREIKKQKSYEERPDDENIAENSHD